MKFGIVIQNNFPIDREVRTRKTAKFLNECGHDVKILAINSKNDGERENRYYDPEVEKLSYAEVTRFSKLVRTSLFSRVSNPSNPLWLSWLVNELRKESFDAVIAADIKVSLPTAIACKVVGIPVVTDIRENYPEYFKQKTLLRNDWLVEFIAVMITFLETICIYLSDQCWVVIDERKKELVSKGVNRNKIVVVRNTPYLSEEGTRDPKETGISGTGDSKERKIVYVGLITELRGLDTIVKSLSSANQMSDKKIKFVIAGDGPNVEYLLGLAKQNGVEEFVEFKGWVDSEQVPRFIASGDLGVIPHRVNEFTNTTIPNKLFDYMFQGIPVLSTEMNPVTRIINECGCGKIIFDDDNPREVGRKIAILVDENDSIEYGHNGYTCVLQKYHWKQDCQKAIDALPLGEHSEITCN